MANNKQIRNVAIVGTGVNRRELGGALLARGLRRHRNRPGNPTRSQTCGVTSTPPGKDLTSSAFPRTHRVIT